MDAVKCVVVHSAFVAGLWHFVAFTVVVGLCDCVVCTSIFKAVYSCILTTNKFSIYLCKQSMPLNMSNTLSARRGCPSNGSCNQTVSNGVTMASTVFIKVFRTQIHGFFCFFVFNISVGFNFRGWLLFCPCSD